MDIEIGMYIKSDYVGNHISCVTVGKLYLVTNKIHDQDDTYIVFKDDNGDDYEVGLLPIFKLGENDYVSEFDMEEWEIVATPQKAVVDTAKYQTININGKPTRLPIGDETDLTQEDIFSLIDIALDNNDRGYFEELIERLNKV